MADRLRIPNPYARHRSGSATRRGGSHNGRSWQCVQQPSPPRWLTKLGCYCGGADLSGEGFLRLIRSACVVPVRHVTEFNAFLFQNGIGLTMLERLVSEDNTA